MVTVRVPRTALVGVAAAVLLLIGAAVLAAQAPPPPPLPIGVLDVAVLERDAPQFAEARAHVAALQDDETAALRATAVYRFLTVAELDEATQLERDRERRTRDQRERLAALVEIDTTHAARYRELLTLPEAKRTPATDTEFGELTALYDACEARQNERLTQARESVAAAIQQREEVVGAALEQAVAQVARERGLALVLEKRVRFDSGSLDAELAQFAYQHRAIVHYGGVDVTQDVLAVLAKSANVAAEGAGGA